MVKCVCVRVRSVIHLVPKLPDASIISADFPIVNLFFINETTGPYNLKDKPLH